MDPRWKNRVLMKRLRASLDIAEARAAFDNYEISALQFKNLMRLERQRQVVADGLSDRGKRSLKEAGQ